MTQRKREDFLGLKNDEEAFRGISPSGEKRDWKFSTKRSRRIRSDESKKFFAFRIGKAVGKLFLDLGVFCKSVFNQLMNERSFFNFVFLVVIAGLIVLGAWKWLWPVMSSDLSQLNLNEFRCLNIAVSFVSFFIIFFLLAISGIYKRERFGEILSLLIHLLFYSFLFSIASTIVLIILNFVLADVSRESQIVFAIFGGFVLFVVIAICIEIGWKRFDRFVDMVLERTLFKVFDKLAELWRKFLKLDKGRKALLIYLTLVLIFLIPFFMNETFSNISRRSLPKQAQQYTYLVLMWAMGLGTIVLFYKSVIEKEFRTAFWVFLIGTGIMPVFGILPGVFAYNLVDDYHYSVFSAVALMCFLTPVTAPLTVLLVLVIGSFLK